MDHLHKPNSNTEVTHPTPSVAAPPGHWSAAPYGLEGLENDESGDGLIEYWHTLRRNKRTILLASLAGLVIGFAIGIPMKPVYRVKTSLEVLSINEDFMNMKQANPNTTVENSYETSEEQTQAKLLESSALLNRVTASLDPDAAKSHSLPRMAVSGWRSLLHLRESVEITPRERLLTKAVASLKVRPTAKTRVLEVTLDSTDSQLAVDFANTLSKEFILQNVEARWATTQQTSQWIRRELDEARDKLRKSEDALQAYASSSGLIFTDETTNVATEKLQQLQLNLSNSTADRITKQSRYELAQNAPPDSLGDVLSDTALRDTQSKMNDLKRQIADLSAIYNPEYSKVRRLQAELDELEPAFGRQRGDIIIRIKNDFTEANRREKLLASAYDRQAQEVTGQDKKAIQYNILKRDVDSNRQLYDTMLQQMKQSSIASAMRASNVRVVDPATIPELPVAPNFKLNSVAGLFAGLFASLLAVIIRERADRTLQQPGDIRTWTDTTELGVIPAAALAGGRSYYRSRGTLESPEAQEKAKESAVSYGNSALVAWKGPSMVAEAFRSTLTSVLFMAESSNRPRVLVFTSANAADGKTTVTSNLAIAAAEIRMRVLVIDADLRRPRMHDVFDVSNERGLVNLLRGDVSESDLSELIQPTGVDSLSVLPAGPPTQSASHLLYSPRWSSLLERVRSDYDMIFVDTPPMLQMTDARVTARLADAVILVGRASQTTRDAFLAAKHRLGEDRIRVLGAVLNDWNPKSSPGGYYGYYKTSYHKSAYTSSASA